MEFFAEIDKEESKWNTKGRNIIINLAKKDTDADYWTRLTKNKEKNSRIAVDWSKWCDSDEEDEAKDVGQDWDPSMMQGFGGGAGGAGGMDMASMFGGAGGMPGMGGMGGPGGMGGMNMEEMMKNLGGAGAGMPDSDDEDEEQEAEGEPKKADALGDLDGDVEKTD